MQIKNEEATSLLNKFRGRFNIAIGDTVGAVTTFMAMVPQGILGGLLADKVLLQLTKSFNSRSIPLLIVRVGVDGLIFITAEEGKRRLVRFFNTETFKNFGKVKWWKNTFFTRWTLFDIISFLVNSGFTIVASAVFAGLAAISFDGIAELLEDYHLPFTDSASTWVRTYYIKAPFMLATFICNLPFFGAIHKFAVKSLLEVGHYLIENPDLRKQKAMIIAEIRAAQLLWKRVNESCDDEGIVNFLTAYYAADGDSLAKKLITIGRNSQNRVKPESWFEFLVKRGFAISLVGVGITGLYNFLDMADKTTVIFNVQEAAPVIRWMDYTSMSAVAYTAIYNMAIAFIGSIFFNRRYNVNLISTFYYAWILFSAFLVCTLGGAPNAYQSILAEENLVLIFIAAIDSLLMEVYGYYSLTLNNKVATITKNNKTKQLAYEIDREIENTLSYVVDKSSVEEISDLSDCATIISPYRPSYQYIRSRLLSDRGAALQDITTDTCINTDFSDISMCSEKIVNEDSESVVENVQEALFERNFGI